MSALVPLAASRKRRIYIAGPMTGIPEWNFPAFNAKAAELRAEGWHVENPAEHGAQEGVEWADYLRYDLTRIATCEAIYLLPGWRDSRGARLEVHVAQALSMAFHGAAVIHPTTLLDALRDLCDQAERSLDYRPEFREALARGLAAIHHATQEQK